MKNLTILLIFLLLGGFSLFLFFEGRTNNVIEVYTPDMIAVDFNKNSVADLDETICVSDVEYINEKAAQLLNLSEQDYGIMLYLTNEFSREFFYDNRVKTVFTNGVKQNCKTAAIFVDNLDYAEQFNNSVFAFKDNKPLNPKLFNKVLSDAQKENYRVLNLSSNKYHKFDCQWGSKSKNSVIIPLKQIDKIYQPCKVCNEPEKITNLEKLLKKLYTQGSIKVFITDFTLKMKPDRKCSTDFCAEIIKQINSAQESIDIAIYGYGRTEGIEEALKNAIKRSVKVRLVYDVDSKGENIYPDTHLITDIIKNNRHDGNSTDAQNTKFQNAIMHNKFFIFDNRVVITGSANLSHTDMSGFNSNISIMFDSKEIAKIYKEQFEQMYNENFHNNKQKSKEKVKNVIGKSTATVYFSPQDSIVTKVVIPQVQKSKKYIYMPVFLITHKELTNELIRAKKRGVDVRLITDAVNVANRASKHKLLRENNVGVKVENYAGKMHAKSIIIDDRVVIIGSMNFSNSGENRNDENVVVLEDSEVSKFCREYFEYLWKKIPDKWAKFSPKAESWDSLGSCSDGLDNDFDGLIDGEDEGCKKFNVN